MNVRQLQERFATVDPRYGPLPWWWWSAEQVTEERIRWQMKKFRDGGLRNIGLIQLAPKGPMFGSPADRPVYMSEEWWRLFEVTLREAERLGMYLWFYDQIGFSGANLTAHLVADSPQFAGYYLARFTPDESLPDTAEVLLETEKYLYVSVRQGFNWLDREAGAALIDRVHGQVERRFPHDLGRTIAGSFQDELPPLPVWTPELSDLFRHRYGEDLHLLLPALFESSSGAENVRRRVYGLAAELAEQAFFKPLGLWHRKHNMLIGCDQAGRGRRADPHSAQRLYHDYFRLLRWYNAPGCDMDGEIKPHSSMVHLHGGQRAWLEAFHSSGWGGTLEETMHWLLPWFLDGATLYSPHAVYYSTRGGWWEWAPPDTGWRQPYFEQYAPFADTVSRVCYLLSQGYHRCDIGVHYPSYAVNGYLSLADVKPGEHTLRASDRDPNQQVAHIREVYWGITGYRNRRDQKQIGALREHKRDFDIVDDLALAKAAPDGDKLRIADEAFSVLLLTGTTLMSEEARRTVDRWIAGGGRVIAVDAPEEEGSIPGAERASSPEEAARLIDRQLPLQVEGPTAALRRRVQDADVFLLLPERGSLLAMHEPAGPKFMAPKPARYHLRTNGRPQLWNPVDGTVRDLHYERAGDMVSVEVPFEDWPAALLVCSEERRTGPTPAVKLPPAEEAHRTDRGETLDLSLGLWRIRVDSTLDNRYGDFDLHGDERGFVPVERRQVRVRREEGVPSGIEAGWQMPGYDDSGWETYLWSESAFWLTARGERFDPHQARPVVYSNVFGDLAERTWMGRMGAVPRRFLDLGQAGTGETVWAKTYVLAPADGEYFLMIESDYRFDGEVDGREIEWEDAPDRQVARVHLTGGANELLLSVRSDREGDIRAAVEVSPVLRPPLPAWIYAKHPSPDSQLSLVVECDPQDPVREARLIFAAKGRAILLVNGKRVTEHGDFHPISRYGQEEVDAIEWWRPGANEVRVVLPEGSGEVLVDGMAKTEGGRAVAFCTGPDWQDERGEPAGVVFGAEGLFAFGSDKEALCIWTRPHPLPDVGWLMPEATPSPPPLPFVLDPSEIGRPVWLRFPLPVGARRMRLEAAGPARVWIDGAEVGVRDGRAEFPPQAAGTLAAVRIEPQGPFTDAAVLLAPIRFETVPAIGALGDWRSVLSLPHFSGAIEYETTFESENWTGAVLDLGHVRGTAEVWLDGRRQGVRVWRPYRFQLGDIPPGSHRLRIRVTNTLGAHYEIGRPTTMVGSHPGITGEDTETARERAILSASGGLFGPVTIRHS